MKTCLFIREGDYLICQNEGCGIKIKTDIPADKLKKNCGDAKPSIIDMAKNLSASAIGFIKDGLKIADDEEQARRMTICEGCDRFDKVSRRCMECGCYSTWKSYLRSSHCPIDKW